MYIVFCFHEHGKRKRILVIKYSRFMWQALDKLPGLAMPSVL